MSDYNMVQAEKKYKACVNLENSAEKLQLEISMFQGIFKLTNELDKVELEGIYLAEKLIKSAAYIVGNINFQREINS